MSKKTNILVINGKKYDYRTGELLESPKSKPLKESAKPKKPSPATAKTAKIKAVPAKKPRQPAKNVDPHAPTRSKTLMRKVVAKPSSSLKRQTKAQSHVNGIKKHSSETSISSISTSAKKIDNRLSTYAKTVKKSPLIQRFSNSDKVPTPQASTPAIKPAPKQPVTPKYTSKRKPQTTAELLEYAIAQATSHEQPAPPKAKKSRNPLKRKT